MIEEHVHCVSCGKAIETTDEDGGVVEIQGRMQAVLLMDQRTGEAVPQSVILPICDKCVTEAREAAALARSRIVVPGAGPGAAGLHLAGR
jgi:hypothetical protein